MTMYMASAPLATGCKQGLATPAPFGVCDDHDPDAPDAPRPRRAARRRRTTRDPGRARSAALCRAGDRSRHDHRADRGQASAGHREEFPPLRSEEHTSELQSLMRNSYAVFCLKNKKITIK